ncbi:hypothetical protein ACFWPA_08965 [Rhodococcus sp. NPDC058505]|uniref:hypothetical protein n=1 Tax=unclassified Rhodococcus (in: high G+C Gram-positive bacteria) TaxID=192944 RepID=UPI00365995ED
MDAVVTRAGTRLADLEEALHQLTTARARVTHPSGLVSVEADEHGGMCGLWLPAALGGVDAGDLGRAVVETAARAAELVAAQREQVLASLARRFTD